MDNSHNIDPFSIGKRTAMKNRKLQDALELMQFNLTEPLSTAEISEHINITPRQLERLFKQNFNLPPSRYYMRLRLEAVREAIRTTQNTVSELAEQFGFSSGSHLSSRYKGYFDVPPSQDRMQQKDKSAA